MDRNSFRPVPWCRYQTSLSARRAWIEISAWGPHGTGAESLSARRAWIEIKSGVNNPGRHRSLSARRAWIEILDTLVTTHAQKVALRKESVDRNSEGIGKMPYCSWSLSARRAWIEIWKLLIVPSESSRSPQGERG